MANTVVVLEQLLVTEDWELGRQVLVEASAFAEDREQIEAEFAVSLRQLDAVLELPDASLRRLKEVVLERVQTRVRDYDDELYQRICVELDYCKNKDVWKWRAAEYLAAILDIVFGGGGVTLAVLLLKREALDRLCKCSKNS